MKKTIIALLALSGIAMGYESYEWAFGWHNHPEEGDTSYTLKSGSYSVTLEASGALTEGEWALTGTDAEILTKAGGEEFWNSVREAGIEDANMFWSANTYIASSGVKDSLKITISGLDSGAYYTVALLTGLPFEGAGAWNTLSLSNDNKVEGKTVVTPALDNQNIAVKNSATGFFAEQVVADTDGNITFTINANGAHTACINSMGIIQTAAAPIPEPTTATLSLLALAGLAARRRRR